MDNAAHVEDGRADVGDCDSSCNWNKGIAGTKTCAQLVVAVIILIILIDRLVRRGSDQLSPQDAVGLLMAKRDAAAGNSSDGGGGIGND